MAVKKKNLPPVTPEHALTLGLNEDEWQQMIEGLGRAPNEVECAIFSALWREEYSLKSTLSFLKTLNRKGERAIKLAGDRASAVDIGDGEAVVFRAEFYNQQCLTEPLLGTAACLAKGISSIAAEGVRPLACLNLLRLGDLERPENVRLLQREIEGLSKFSNVAGVPIIGGEFYVHPAYDESPVVNGMCLGIGKKEDLIQQVQAKEGSSLLYLGMETGREGLTKEGSLPKRYLFADPFFAANFSQALRTALEQKLVLDYVEVSEGGLGTAFFETAHRFSLGVKVDLDRVPKRESTMTSTEVILSQTPLRALAITAPGKHRALGDCLHQFGVSAQLIGELVDTDDVEILWGHQEIANIPYSFSRQGLIEKEFEISQFPPMLRKKSSQELDSKREKISRGKQDEWAMLRNAPMLQKQARAEGIAPLPDSLEDVWLDLLADPNLASKRRIYEHFDQTLHANSSFIGGGDAAILRVERGRQKALALSVDANVLYVRLDPYLGAVQTVAEAMRNISATGATPVAISHCLSFGDPQRHKDISEISEVIRGLGDACRAWGLFVVSDSVSLFNGTEGSPILGSPAVAMIGVLDDVKKACTIGFKEAGDKILLLGETKMELGGSEYLYYCHKILAGDLPDIDFEVEKKTCALIQELIAMELLCSAHDLSSGGLALCLAESCLEREKPIGAQLTLQKTITDQSFRPDALLFSESSARFLISCKSKNVEEVRSQCAKYGVSITGEGEVGGKFIEVNGALECTIALSTMHQIWSSGLDHLFGNLQEQVEV